MTNILVAMTEIESPKQPEHPAAPVRGRDVSLACQMTVKRILCVETYLQRQISTFVVHLSSYPFRGRHGKSAFTDSHRVW